MSGHWVLNLATLKSIQVVKKRRILLDFISFELGRRPVAVLGENGAGKSTLFRVLAGLERRYSGDLTFLGEDAKSSKGFFLQRSSIGYLPQTVDRSINFRVIEAVKYAGWLKGLKGLELETAVADALNLANCSKFANEKLKTLSGGELKRVGLAQVYVHRPKLLLLDEPTAALDPAERSSLLQTLRNTSGFGTLVFSTHLIADLVDFEGDVLVLKNGGVKFFGSVDHFKARAASLGDSLTVLESAYKSIVES